jgi:hypothetical protein
MNQFYIFILLTFLTLGCTIPRPLSNFIYADINLNEINICDSIIAIKLKLNFPDKSVDKNGVIEIKPILCTEMSEYELSTINIVGRNVNSYKSNSLIIDTENYPKEYYYTDTAIISNEYKYIKLYLVGSCYLENKPKYKLSIPTDTILTYYNCIK